jgi:membrane associated rhomboid family serine protease
MKPFKPPVPYATNGLIAMCVAVQAVIALGGPVFGRQLQFLLALVPVRISAVFTGVGSPVTLATLVSYIFLHGGWLHLGLNLLFLVWVGRYVEWVTGRWAMLSLFLTGGIVGGGLQVAVAPQSMVGVVGASGAIAAVFGAYAILFARSQMEPRTILGLRLSGETLTALWLAAAWIGLQLLTGLVFNSGGGGFAIWTHIGGFLVGLVAARLWGRGPQIS